jgi:hypothetical protein
MWVTAVMLSVLRAVPMGIGRGAYAGAITVTILMAARKWTRRAFLLLAENQARLDAQDQAWETWREVADGCSGSAPDLHVVKGQPGS